MQVDRAMGSIAKPHELVDDLVEPLPLNELHGVERDAGIATDFEDGHDIRVMQPRGSPRFASEPLERLAVASHVIR